MLDAGVVYVGQDAKTLPDIFGDDLKQTSDPLRALILFERKAPPIPRDVQVDLSKWYLACDFDQNRRLTNYFLTNIGKGGMPHGKGLLNDVSIPTPK
jgi:hypothetical protein